MKRSGKSRYGGSLVVWPFAAIALVFGMISLGAAPADISDVAGVHKLALSAGPNFIAAPLHHAPSFRGAVSSATVGTISVAGNPGWSPNQFGPQDGSAQFIALLRKDASASPGNEGEWWPVTANTANSFSVDTRSADLTTIVANGDEIEIRRLTNLKDLFGTGATLILNKDSNGSASPNDEDVLYLVSGTSFSSEIFYHDGSVVLEGYYVDGEGPFDGSTITIGPDEPIMLFRKSGSPAKNVLLAGNVQSTRLTHYLKTGPNPVATAFPVDAPIASTGLLEAGWLADSDGSANPADEDVLYTVTGSSFVDEVFYHDGSLVEPGWYANGSANGNFPLASGAGLILFVKNPAGISWRESVPF
jgi:uncharacterized protein (TIGR02597 family)